MGDVLMTPMGGVIQSDDLTAVAANVASGKLYVGADTDGFEGTGTLSLSGDAAPSDVIKGKTFYNNSLHEKRTGTLEFTGNAAASNVFTGVTFYSNNPQQKMTGTAKVRGAIGKLEEAWRGANKKSVVVPIRANSAAVIFISAERNDTWEELPTINESIPAGVQCQKYSAYPNYGSLPQPGRSQVTAAYVVTNGTNAAKNVTITISYGTAPDDKITTIAYSWEIT